MGAGFTGDGEFGDGEVSGDDPDVVAKQEAFDRLDNMSFAQVIQEGHLALLKDLVAAVNSGTATHQEKAILRNFLRDNGMTLAVPPSGMSLAENPTPGGPKLPEFGDPEYDNN